MLCAGQIATLVGENISSTEMETEFCETEMETKQRFASKTDAKMEVYVSD
jgi:hypothetical protein